MTIVIAAIPVLVLSACGGDTGAPALSSQVTTPAAASASSTGAHNGGDQPAGSTAPQARHQGGSAEHLRPVHDPGTVTGTLNGPCHTRDHGQLPDPSCTPGAIDPAVTQATIQSTICQAGYTAAVRPPESQTEQFKWNVAEPAYGQHGISGELDHLVPLELGGANDAANLWVEAGPIPNQKDPVENALKLAVCNGQITLREAQLEIARNWLEAAATLGIRVTQPDGQASGGTATAPEGGGAWCSATASYSPRYADWDVYVRSNQPGATVTASSGSYSHSWHTNGSGSADVYLHGPSPGELIHVTVGPAACTTSAS